MDHLGDPAGRRRRPGRFGDRTSGHIGHLEFEAGRLGEAISCGYVRSRAPLDTIRTALSSLSGTKSIFTDPLQGGGEFLDRVCPYLQAIPETDAPVRVSIIGDLEVQKRPRRPAPRLSGQKPFDGPGRFFETFFFVAGEGSSESTTHDASLVSNCGCVERGPQGLREIPILASLTGRARFTKRSRPPEASAGMFGWRNLAG